MSYGIEITNLDGHFQIDGVNKNYQILSEGVGRTGLINSVYDNQWGVNRSVKCFIVSTTLTANIYISPQTYSSSEIWCCSQYIDTNTNTKYFLIFCLPLYTIDANGNYKSNSGLSWWSTDYLILGYPTGPCLDRYFDFFIADSCLPNPNPFGYGLTIYNNVAETVFSTSQYIPEILQSISSSDRTIPLISYNFGGTRKIFIELSRFRYATDLRRYLTTGSRGHYFHLGLVVTSEHSGFTVWMDYTNDLLYNRFIGSQYYLDGTFMFGTRGGF